LCSHCALSESVLGDHGLTPEQLEAQAAELKQRRAAQQAEISRRWEQEARLNNLEAVRAKKRKIQAAYVERHSEKAKAHHNNSLAKAKANRTYSCAVCDLACGKKNDLARHNNSKSHITKATAAAAPGLFAFLFIHCCLC
jgi:hypothetical protein